jgi:hypothetical protein
MKKKSSEIMVEFCFEITITGLSAGKDDDDYSNVVFL